MLSEGDPDLTAGGDGEVTIRNRPGKESYIRLAYSLMLATLLNEPHPPYICSEHRSALSIVCQYLPLSSTQPWHPSRHPS